MRYALVLLAACGSKGSAPPIAHDAAPAPRPPPPVTPAADAAVVDAAVAVEPPCSNAPAGAELAALPSGTWSARRGDDRWILFDRGDRCDVFEIGRAAARAFGEVWPGYDGLKEFALVDDRCGEPDGCPSVVAVKSGDVILDALDACERAVDIGLHVVEIIDGQPSLLVSCVTHTGWGLEERLRLLHVIDGKLTRVLDVDGGWGDHGPGECGPCQDYCWTQLDEARWKRISSGVVETTAPIGYMDQVEGTGGSRKNVTRWRFDGTKFVAGKRRHVDTAAQKDVCAPLPLRTPLR